MTMVRPALPDVRETGRPVAAGTSAQHAGFAPALFLSLAGLLLLLYFAPWPLAILAALGVVALTSVRPDFGLACVILASPFYRFPKESADLALPLSEVAVWLVLAGVAVRWARRPGPLDILRRAAWRDLLGPYWPALVFLAVATVSLAASEFLRFSLREYRQVIVEPLIVGGLILLVARTPREIRVLVRAVVGTGVLVATISIFHYYAIGVTEATGGVERALAIYHSPNALGLFLGRVAPVALVLAVFGRSFGRERWLAAGAAAIIGYALLLTYSRGAWLGVAAALIFVAAWRGRRTLVAGLTLLLVGGLALIPVVGWDRLWSVASSSQRLYLWGAAWAMVRDHPWQGIGLDNFRYLYPRYMHPDAWQEPDISHPHNLVFDFWLRLGLAGLVAFAWVQASFWRAGRQVWRSGATGERVMALALMASMVDTLAHGLLDNSYFLIDLAVIFWVTYALMHCLRSLVQAPQTQVGSPSPART